jgi:putative ABC transport system ATP-binding protein
MCTIAVQILRIQKMKNDLPGSAVDRRTIVSAEGLGKRVATTDTQLTILTDVNFHVIAGEAVAIVGASGSGKSTLLGLLAGLDMPSSGRVVIDGADLSTLSEDARAALRGRLIGFVFQSFQLLPALNALENVMLPLELAGQADARQQAQEILGRVGLAARLGHYPKQLSGGEQQRVALARAFVTRPKLLLADEPTGNLDAHTGQQVIDLLFQLNRERGTTLLLVTHDEALASRCARRLKLVAGELVPNSEALAK